MAKYLEALHQYKTPNFLQDKTVVELVHIHFYIRQCGREAMCDMVLWNRITEARTSSVTLSHIKLNGSVSTAFPHAEQQQVHGHAEAEVQ